MSAPNTPLREEISLQRQTPTTTIPGTGSSVTIPGAGSSVSRAGVKSIGLDECRLGQVTVPQKSFPQVPFRQDPMQDPTSIASSTLTLPGLKVEDGVDLGNTLQHIVGKGKEAHIKGKELGVMFRDLHVVGLGASASYIPTFSSMVNPSSILEAIQKVRHPPVRDILNGFEGAVRPGEMLLVLGMPGSGCSTLLKILANLREEYHAVEGNVYYDSISPEDIQRHFRGDVQYSPEDDIHFPTLTVDQTLAFAANTRTSHVRIDQSRQAAVKCLTDRVITTFGLNHTRDTPVGDAVIRGVSGGEKKRVSIAEVLTTRSCITCWDNSTRGLDSSTALEFVRALRIATDTSRLASILCLYQAGESLYRHFDKVCVLYEGRMAYYGPASQARQYFIDMGYEPANRQTTADFLVSVTNPKGRIPRAGIITPRPRTAAEFADYFKKSEQGCANKADTEAYYSEFVGKPDRASAYIESAQQEHAKGFNKDSPYLISVPMQARAVMLRRLQILRGDFLVTGLNLFSYVFQALICGSMFVKLPYATSAFFSRGGALFFTMFFTAATALAEISGLYAQRRVIHRHKNAALYHPFVEALAHTLVDVPITFVSIAVFGILVYFMVGLQRTASQFFIFFLFFFSMALVMKAWFRAIAAVCKSEATAQTFAGISVLMMTMYTGYVIPKPTIIGALRWLTYLNPLRYGFEAMLTNEMRTLNGVCFNLVPQGPGYEQVQLSNQVCATVGSVPGQTFVNGALFAQLSFGYSFSNTWKNFGIVVAMGVGCFMALLIFTEFNTSLVGETAAVLFKRGSRKASSGSFDEEIVKLEEKLALDIIDGNIETERPEKDHLPATDIFSWQHLNYTVPVAGQEDRRLLCDVSGYVVPGKLTALMGESGAGKTTLLNVLAERVDTGVVTGDRFVNGQGLPKDFQSQTGYCQQTDTHVPTATVREALLFSAKLRQPTSTPLAEKEAYVEKCLRMCGIEAYANASVGSLGVELRKRTTIGVELAAKPKLLLFLDEPTSGLDSQSAWGIMAFLKSLADNGQAILCTIHQPSAELFQVFDRLLLLRKGGQTVYFGDLGDHALTIIEYLESNGSRKCLPDENPAEFMLDVIGAGATAGSEQDWYQIWSASKQATQLQVELDNIHTTGHTRMAPVEAIHHSEFVTPWLYQAIELLKRDAEAHWRDPHYLGAKLALNIFGGLFVGFTFFQSKDSQQGTQDKLFAIFMATILSAPLANQLQVPFIAMRSIYEVRERPSRMYSWTALLASQIIIETPWNILGSSLFFLCWYWTVGFDSSRAGYTYLLYGVVFPVYYSTLGQATASIAPTAEVGALLFSLLITFVIVFDGALQPFRALGWWQWMYRLSPFSYLLEGLLGQAIGRQQINCAAIEFVTITPPSGQTCLQYMNQYISLAGGYLTNPNATSSCQFCAVRTTDQLIAANYNMSYSHHWRNFGLMVAYVIFNISCVFLLTYLFRIRTGSLLPFFKRSKKP